MSYAVILAKVYRYNHGLLKVVVSTLSSHPLGVMLVLIITVVCLSSGDRVGARSDDLRT